MLKYKFLFQHKSNIGTWIKTHSYSFEQPISKLKWIFLDMDFAERSLQTLKNIFKKCWITYTDCYIFIASVPSCKEDDMTSPTENLMSLNLRTNIALHFEYIEPKDSRFRRWAKKAIVTVTSCVYFKKNPLSVCFPGTLVEECKQPRT